MKTAILIHGYYNKSEFEDVNRPLPSNDHWFPWLQRQLMLKGIANRACKQSFRLCKQTGSANIQSQYSD
jgi:hypothetical protein